MRGLSKKSIHNPHKFQQKSILSRSRLIYVAAWMMAVVGTSCVQGRFLPAVRENFSPTSVEKVVVHFKDCPKQVQMIGSVIVDASEPLTQGSMIDRLRAEAAKGGGHGICNIQYRKTKGGSLLPGAGEYDPSGFRNATCLVFRFP